MAKSTSGFIIKGGKRLSGAVTIGGAKNYALKVFGASFLFKNPVKITKVPDIEDIARMTELLTDGGADVKKTGKHEYSVFVPDKIGTSVNENISKHLRASVVLIGPMLARFGRISLPHPGGCVIGKRPIDFFIDGFEKMGAKVFTRGNRYIFESKGLQGGDIFLKTPSVTATESIMMAGVLADGITTINNSAREPEIPALAEFLNKSGAKITGAGTSKIVIDGGGKKGLLSAKEPVEVIPDRIEAGSFLILGAVLGSSTDGGIRIRKCNPDHLQSLIYNLGETGVKTEIGKNWINISRPKAIYALDLRTEGYPGFATDLQAPFSVLLTQAHGTSTVFETMFDGRLEYLSEFKRMGADIIQAGENRAIIKGPSRLHGRELESPDLRAGLAFIIASLVARGESIIHNCYQVDRGYEHIEKKLKKLGADIKRVNTK